MRERADRMAIIHERLDQRETIDIVLRIHSPVARTLAQWGRDLIAALPNSQRSGVDSRQSCEYADGELCCLARIGN